MKLRVAREFLRLLRSNFHKFYRFTVHFNPEKLSSTRLIFINFKNLSNNTKINRLRKFPGLQCLKNCLRKFSEVRCSSWSTSFFSYFKVHVGVFGSFREIPALKNGKKTIYSQNSAYLGVDAINTIFWVRSLLWVAFHIFWESFPPQTW